MERNWDQHVARTAYLQCLDQIHDETAPKEKDKTIRQSKRQYLNGMVAKTKQKRNANASDHLWDNLDLEERVSIYCKPAEKWKYFIFKKGSCRKSDQNCLWKWLLKGSRTCYLVLTFGEQFCATCLHGCILSY